jgi:predicted ribosomally synthesized peptide with SipW-like signal peptide
MSLLVVTLIGALAGGGLFAHFTDTEESVGNQFTAGTLDLKPDDIAMESVNLAPCCWQVWDAHTLTNAGNLD